MPYINKLPRKKREYGKYELTGKRKECHDIYDTQEWKRLRLAKFIDQPTCELCAKKGIVRPADEIHHIVPFTTAKDIIERQRLAFDYNNLLSLCVECHRKIHSRTPMGENSLESDG